MKNLWILLLCLYSMSPLNAQSILTENVITACAGHCELNAETVDWTLGEWMIEFHSGTHYLENGIH